MYRRRSQINDGNIFAHELQNVLRHYNLDLSLLDDRVGLHPEKVRRLVQSLHSLRSFPILNVTEMDQLHNTLSLSADDTNRLHAAILAASIEKTLADRINQNDAVHAANQIFPIILEALENEATGTQGLGNTRGGPDTDSADDSSLDESFGQAFAAIDAGEQALSLGSRMSSTKKASQLQLAVTSFTEALQILNELPDYVRRGAEWRHWQQDAQQGLALAREQLSNI